MLTSLHIENIAVVEKADVSFDSGFNVLTGETGAGKSIVIDAISAVLGERTSHDLIRTGCESASVTAVFENVGAGVVRLLNEQGYDCEDGTVIIMRKISSDGRNTVRVNGIPSTVGILKTFGSELLNIHGQHDSQKLLEPAYHIRYIDAVCENTELLSKYRKALAKYEKSSAQLDELLNSLCEKENRADYLRFCVDELESAQIEIGEREQLIRQRDLMRNSAEIAGQLSQVYGSIRGDGYSQDIPSVLKNAADILYGAAKYIPDLSQLAEQLEGFGYETEEIASKLDGLLAKTEFDPSLLEDIEARLDYLFRLSKKYGNTEADMLDFLVRSRNELASIDNSDERASALQQEKSENLAELTALADELTELRTETAGKFVENVCAQLKFLDMPNAELKANISKTDFTQNGRDSIEFMISVNAGETVKPLAKIASGGELSRIMLAIKSVLADKDDVDTLIFDEIDTGISGSAARKVGVKIRQTAENRQVICVTHLPQIASLADVHFRIIKNSDGGRTFTEIERLDETGRIEELARIMSTGIVTDAMRASAAELINDRI